MVVGSIILKKPGCFPLFMQKYDLLVDRISSLAGLGKEEVEQRVEAKRAKLSGLISKEGAAQIVAAELGINFDNVQLKVHELMPGMKKVNLIGKIVNLFPVREFNKNNRQGKVVNFILADETGSLRVVLWDTNHIELIEKSQIKLDDVIEIRNASMRNNELHLSGFSEIKKSGLVLENVRMEMSGSEKEIKEVHQGDNVELRGVVVQMFNPRFFNVCPECGKKPIQEAEGFSCKEHGKITPKERSLLNFVLDDGTDSIRVVLFSEQLNKIVPEENLKDPEKVIVFKEDFLGEEFFVKGAVKKNQLFNNLEVNASDVQKVDVDKLVDKLEA